jgi:hypothetical protein
MSLSPHRTDEATAMPNVSSWGQSGCTLTGNRNRSSIFAFVAFWDGKPDSTFPENA